MKKNFINLNEYSNIAKVGTKDEDWSLAFDYVFSNVVKDNCAKIIWSGQLKIKSTINVPYGISLQGISLPYSGLIPTSDFKGEWVLTQLSIDSHIDFRNIYIGFEQNPNVGGIYIRNPYDYSTLDNIVGSSLNKTFIKVGGDKISQTLRVENCLCYSKNTIKEPIVIIDNLQEGYFCNNKFMSSGYCDVNMVECDGVVTTTFINNSFVNTKKRFLAMKCKKYPKRLSGNLITGNLFENCYGDYDWSIEGSEDSNLEGYNNTITGNDYLNSSYKGFLNGVANCIVIDKATLKYGSYCRRTFNINPYDSYTAKDPYGNCELKPDGDKLLGKYKGDFYGNFKMDVGRKNLSQIWWNANKENDYGMNFEVDGVKRMQLAFGNIYNNTKGGGVSLLSPSGKQFVITVSDSGNLIIS